MKSTRKNSYLFLLISSGRPPENERGGGIFSTASDLLIWNEALTSNRLGAFVTEKLHEPTKLNNNRKFGYARGLFVNTHRGGTYFWHTGGSAGYSSLLSSLSRL